MMNKDSIKASLSETLSVGRYAHTLGVLKAAQELSAIHGIDQEKAYFSALLHDCAKCLPLEDMISLIQEEGIDADDFELSTEPILHAPAGAALAKKKYGVTDREILDAIRYHTIGCENPSKLTKLIYVCDFIEEGRKMFDGLEEARRLAIEDLDSALLLCAKLSNDYVLKNGGKIHPMTIKMIKDTEVHS